MLYGFNQNDLTTLRQLAWRQVQAKYSQTILGLVWSLITPLVLLSVYGVIYSGIFKAQWIRPDGSQGDYALFIFSGLVIFSFAAEVINSSTFLIRSNSVLVKRTAINPAILPMVNVLSAGFHFLVSLIPFVAYYMWREGVPHLTALMTPLPIILLAVFLLGVSYFLSALAVYFQDLQQLVPILVTVMLFLSPVFYSLSQVPEGLQSVVKFGNPLASVIEVERGLIFEGVIGTPIFYFGFGLASTVLAFLGLKFYRFASTGFSDVI